MFPENLEQTAQTQAKYYKRAVSLIRRAKIALGLSLTDSLDPRQFVAWLSEQRKTLARTSWRQYKSAVVCFLSKEPPSGSVDEALDWLRDVDVEGCQKKTEKTSGTKLKRLNQRDFQRITEYLRENKGKWNTPLLDWMVSATLTGLRPQEWADAKLDKIDGEIALVVKNAKSTNGRAHGFSRTLLLGALSVDEIDTLRRHVERASQFAGVEQFDELYHGCSHTLHYVCRKLWPRRTKHVTLYSCRHQFSANAKASGFERDEIAAMMGHAVDDTAIRHYGKKSAGDELVRVRAHKDDVDKVIQKQRGWPSNVEPSIRRPLRGMPSEGLLKPGETPGADA